MLEVECALETLESGEVASQFLSMGEIPMMTPQCTFILNGSERTVVMQSVRSSGLYFAKGYDEKRHGEAAAAKFVPVRGPWVELDISPEGALCAKFSRDGKLIPFSLLARAMGAAESPALTAEALGLNAGDAAELFPDDQTDAADGGSLSPALAAQVAMTRALGNPKPPESAREAALGPFMDERRYDAGPVGRTRINGRLGRASQSRALEAEDLMLAASRLVAVWRGEAELDHRDDIDHFGNRRVRAVGEQLINALRPALLAANKAAQERFADAPPDAPRRPSTFVPAAPLQKAARAFFNSQLSQLSAQINPVDEFTQKRRVSQLGPGGLNRRSAGFEVRDVHYSSYGRTCPIETPEGGNIGLITSLASCARVSADGFMETPYRKVDRENGGGARVSEDVEWLGAHEESGMNVAQATAPRDAEGRFSEALVDVRRGEDAASAAPDEVDCVDVSPMQMISHTASLIPFLEHDDANRALMGSNMQRQAVPLVRPEAPVIGTGGERRIAEACGRSVRAQASGRVVSAASEFVVVETEAGESVEHRLPPRRRSNHATEFRSRPIVRAGDDVSEGQAIADGPSMDRGEMALGHNLIVAFMSWEGYNYEDGIILSSRLVRDDFYTSTHIAKYAKSVRETDYGAKQALTSEPPDASVPERARLDEGGAVKVGEVVRPGDVLVGVSTPKREGYKDEMTPEEKLLAAVFGKEHVLSARPARDDSLRAPAGASGRVMAVKRFGAEYGADALDPGELERVKVWIAQTRKVTEGDKMAGRHGNKGVVARVLPEEDMPHLEDGTSVDIILNPLGVPSRMNLGQSLEMHLGWAASRLGFRVQTTAFDSAPDTAIEAALALAWIAERSGAVDRETETSVDDRRIDWNRVRAFVAEWGFSFGEVFGYFKFLADGVPPPHAEPGAAGGPREGGKAVECALRIWFADRGFDEARGMSAAELRAEAFRISREEAQPTPICGKFFLYDGRTGERTAQPVALGRVYMIKLNHLIDDKAHARSVGPYASVTQQPLGGKAKFGGQRLGEMEVWALEAYGAAHTLQEMLTIKSDDVEGRAAAYEAIIRGGSVEPPNAPESFYALMKRMQSLGLSPRLGE